MHRKAQTFILFCKWHVIVVCHIWGIKSMNFHILHLLLTFHFLLFNQSTGFHMKQKHYVSMWMKGTEIQAYFPFLLTLQWSCHYVILVAEQRPRFFSTTIIVLLMTQHVRVCVCVGWGLLRDEAAYHEWRDQMHMNGNIMVNDRKTTLCKFSISW